jgi:hypothetical protein
MSFQDYLTEKKIDALAFQQAEPALYDALKVVFDQMHPASFTAQKLYLINPLRRKYWKKDMPAALPAQEPTPPRPVMRPKPKIT